MVTSDTDAYAPTNQYSSTCLRIDFNELGHAQLVPRGVQRAWIREDVMALFDSHEDKWHPVSYAVKFNYFVICYLVFGNVVCCWFP
jgi:hypothetical protein